MTGFKSKNARKQSGGMLEGAGSGVSDSIYVDSAGNATQGFNPSGAQGRAASAAQPQPRPQAGTTAKPNIPFTQTDDYYKLRANQKADSARYEADRVAKQQAWDAARAGQSTAANAPKPASMTSRTLNGVKDIAGKTRGFVNAGGKAVPLLLAADAIMQSTDDDSTARYAKRFGVDEPTGDGSLGDILKFGALRAGGFATDLGSSLTFGLADKLYQDKQAVNADQIPNAGALAASVLANKMGFGKFGKIAAPAAGYLATKMGVDALTDDKNQKQSGVPIQPGTAQNQQQADTMPQTNQVGGFNIRSRLVNGVPTFDDSNVPPEMQAKLASQVQTMPSSAVMSADPYMQDRVTDAVRAAAARGDWDAVDKHYKQGRWANGSIPAEDRVAFLSDPDRMPSNAEMMQARMQAAREGQSLARKDLEQRGALGFRALDIEQQKNRATNEQSGLVGDLYAQYRNAKTEAEQAQILNQIRTITGDATLKPKDRYLTLGGGQEWDVEAGAMRNVPQRVFDAQTQQIVGEQQSKASRPLPNHIDALRKNPALAEQFDEIYGNGSAAAILGKA